MTHIFYLIGLWFLIYEFCWLMNVSDRVEERFRYKELSKLNKGRKWDDLTPEYKEIAKKYLFLFPVFLWLFVGLLSSQWALFAVYLLISCAIFNPISRIGNNKTWYAITHSINAVIGVAFAGLVILNKYHLHIDFGAMVKQYFI